MDENENAASLSLSSETFSVAVAAANLSSALFSAARDDEASTAGAAMVAGAA